MILKPQDVVIALKLVTIERELWTYVTMSYQLHISASEINAGIKRLIRAHLVLPPGKRSRTRAILRPSLYEFLIHGVKYSFPPERGELTRGMPTAYAAPPLREMIQPSSDPPPVWPDPDGEVRGVSFSPLYPTVPQAAGEDASLYELLALVDAIRDGRSRERKLAEKEIKKRVLLR
jgi:hypothetical protein